MKLALSKRDPGARRVAHKALHDAHAIVRTWRPLYPRAGASYVGALALVDTWINDGSYSQAMANARFALAKAVASAREAGR